MIQVHIHIEEFLFLLSLDSACCGHFGSSFHGRWSRTLRPQDTSAPRHIGTTKLVPKFKTNHRWSCVSSELSWVEVSRLFLNHGTCVEVSRTTFLLSECLETGAEVSQSVLMPKCPVTVFTIECLLASLYLPVFEQFTCEGIKRLN